MNTNTFESIAVSGYRGRWSAIDEYSDGEADYILLENISFKIGMAHIVCQVTADGDLIMLGKTYKHKLSEALDEIKS